MKQKLLNCFPGHVDCGFEETVVNFSSTVPKFSAQGTKTTMKPFFFQKSSFPQKVPLDTQNAISTTLFKFFCPESKNFPSKHGKDGKTIIFPKKYSQFVSLDTYFFHKLQFRKPYCKFVAKCAKTFPKWPKLFAQGTKFSRKTSFPKMFLKTIPRTRRMQFWHPLPPIFSLKMSISEKVFPTCFPVHGTCNLQVWKHCRENFAKSSKIFLSKYENFSLKEQN